MKNLKIFENLKVPTNLFVFVGLVVVFFDINYYLLTKLPGTADLACVAGGNITPLNLIFSILLSLLSALMFSGVIMLASARKAGKTPAAGIAGVGAVIGTFTIFCTTCSLPFISLFGLSVGLGFFTTYNLTIKIISLIVMVIGLYYLENQLRGNCNICKK